MTTRNTTQQIADVQAAEALIGSLQNQVATLKTAVATYQAADPDDNDDEKAALDAEFTKLEALFPTPDGGTVNPSPTDPDQTPQPKNPPAQQGS